MSDDQKLSWLRNYERQNPGKYLTKFGKVIGRIPVGQPFAGQPNKWEYVSPEDALRTISPSYMMANPLKVEIVEKAEVKQELEFAPEPVAGKVKQGRKKNV